MVLLVLSKASQLLSTSLMPPQDTPRTLMLPQDTPNCSDVQVHHKVCDRGCESTGSSIIILEADDQGTPAGAVRATGRDGRNAPVAI